MNDQNYYSEEIDKCITCLNEGMLILYPTDTVWGIGCDAQNDVAVNRIFEIKNRPDSKSFVILVGSIEEITHYASSPSKDMLEHRLTSTKPVTFVLNDGKNLSAKVINHDGTVAIRVPQDLFCQELLRKYGKALVSTSANISGEPTPPTFKDISDKLIHGVDYVVQINHDDKTIKSGSRIIRENPEGGIEILRS